MGASVYVVTNNDTELAQACADELGEWIFARRADWHDRMLSTREALDKTQATDRIPESFEKIGFIYSFGSKSSTISA